MVEAPFSSVLREAKFLKELISLDIMEELWWSVEFLTKTLFQETWKQGWHSWKTTSTSTKMIFWQSMPWGKPLNVLEESSDLSTTTAWWFLLTGDTLEQTKRINYLFGLSPTWSQGPTTSLLIKRCLLPPNFTKKWGKNSLCQRTSCTMQKSWKRWIKN